MMHAEIISDQCVAARLAARACCMGQIDAPKQVQVRKSARRLPVRDKGGLASRESTAVAQLWPKKDVCATDIPPSVWPRVQLDDDFSFTHTTHRTQLAEVMEASLLCEHLLHLLMANVHHAPLVPLSRVTSVQAASDCQRSAPSNHHTQSCENCTTPSSSRVESAHAHAHWWWVGG